MMTDTDLAEFRTRCLMASQRGWLVARADEYMAVLAEEAGAVEPPNGAAEGSAAHLAALASEALAVRAGGKKKSAKKADPPKKADPVKPAAPPPAPVKPAPVPVKEEEFRVESYDDWSYDELYSEAQKRDLPNRSKMKTKEALIAGLVDDDAKHGV